MADVTALDAGLMALFTVALVVVKPRELCANKLVANLGRPDLDLAAAAVTILLFPVCLFS